jgi:hypothetical protein
MSQFRKWGSTREREKRNQWRKDYYRSYSAKIQAEEKKAGKRRAASAAEDSRPSRVIPQLPQRATPTILVWPDGGAASARHEPT